MLLGVFAADAALASAVVHASGMSVLALHGPRRESATSGRPCDPLPGCAFRRTAHVTSR